MEEEQCLFIECYLSDCKQTTLIELSFSLKRYLLALSSACSLPGFQFFFSMQIVAVKAFRSLLALFSVNTRSGAVGFCARSDKPP